MILESPLLLVSIVNPTANVFTLENHTLRSTMSSSVVSCTATCVCSFSGRWQCPQPAGCAPAVEAMPPGGQSFRVRRGSKIVSPRFKRVNTHNGLVAASPQMFGPGAMSTSMSAQNLSTPLHPGMSQPALQRGKCACSEPKYASIYCQSNAS